MIRDPTLIGERVPPLKKFLVWWRARSRGQPRKTKVVREVHVEDTQGSQCK